MYPNIVNDGAYHVVSIERKGDRMLVTLDNDQIVNLPMTGKTKFWVEFLCCKLQNMTINMGACILLFIIIVGITDRSDQSITYTTLYVGANKNREDIFRGAIGGKPVNSTIIKYE